ncbi:MAG TPA: hypothetical protein VIK08_04000 [Candidatus Limnocylindrales bacterium]
MPRLHPITSLALAATLAGCTALLPSETPSPASSVAPSLEPTVVQPTPAVDSPTALVSAAPTATPTFQPPTATASPTQIIPTPAPTPVAGDLDLSWLPDAPRRTSTIDWQSVDVTGLGAGVINGIIQFGGLLVMTGAIGNADYEAMIPMAWTSTNGRDWVAAEVNVSAGVLDDTVGAAMGQAVAAGPGLVSAGDQFAVVSPDGRHWDAIQDDDLTGWSLGRLVVVNGIILCSGFNFGPTDEYGLFRSQDGEHWDPIAGNTVQHIAKGLMNLTAIDGAFVAFVAENGDPYGANGIEIWRSGDGTNWTHVNDMPDSAETEGVAIVQGEDKFVAVSGHDLFSGYDKEVSMAWSSTDGFNWTRTPGAPWGPYDLLGVGSGFVGVGGRFPTEGTGIQYEDAVTGESWVSADGENWQKVRQPGEGREIDLLLPLGDYIAGYGLDFNRSPNAAMWITPTPDFSR